MRQQQKIVKMVVSGLVLLMIGGASSARRICTANWAEEPDYQFTGLDQPLDTLPAVSVEYLDHYLGFGDAAGSGFGRHPGIDYAANSGTDVFSIFAGRIVAFFNTCADDNGGLAEQKRCGGGWGNYVLVEHYDLPDNRDETRLAIYAHLRSNIAVEEDQCIGKGDLLGEVGNSGNSDGTHIHFQIDRDGDRVAYFPSDRELPHWASELRRLGYTEQFRNVNIPAVWENLDNNDDQVGQRWYVPEETKTLVVCPPAETDFFRDVGNQTLNPANYVANNSIPGPRIDLRIGFWDPDLPLPAGAVSGDIAGWDYSDEGSGNFSIAIADRFNAQDGTAGLGAAYDHHGGGVWVHSYQFTYAGDDSVIEIYLQDVNKNGVVRTISYLPGHEKAYLLQGCIGFLWWRYQDRLGGPTSDEERPDGASSFEAVQQFQYGTMSWNRDTQNVSITCQNGLCDDLEDQGCTSPDLDLGVSSMPSTVMVAQHLELPVIAGNRGATAAPNARTIYDIPRELTVVSSPCVVTRKSAGPSQVICSHGDLASGQTAEATVVVEALGEVPPGPGVAVTSPSNGGLFSVGDALNVTWSTNDIDPGAEMTVSMKRDAAALLPAPDGLDWIRFTETALNSGSLTVAIPATARVASDWRAYVRHNASGVFDASDAPFTVTSPDSATVTLTQPNGAGTHAVGDWVTLAWTTTNALATDEMTLSMKRDAVPPSVTEPDGVNWVRFTTSAPNAGSATVTIPAGVASASDWRFYVGHNASGAFDGSDELQTVTGGMRTRLPSPKTTPTRITVTTRAEVLSDLPDANPSDNVAHARTTIILGGDGVETIDIKPGSSKNPVNPRSRGKIPVAILSSAAFDAPTLVDQNSLTFGRTGDEPSLHYRGDGSPNCHGDDVDSDWLVDLVCHFFTEIAGFQPGDTEGILRGVTTDGVLFEGRDAITTVGQGYDGDVDSVDDETEDLAPNQGDGNGDGVLDSLQLRVVSVPSAATGAYLTLVAEPPCLPTNMRTLVAGDGEVPADRAFAHPQGLLAFDLVGLGGERCTTADLTLFVHGEEDLSGAEYRKYGPTASHPSPHWHRIDATIGATLIDDWLVPTVEMSLFDGGTGDGDGIADGVITDPGGPGVRLPAQIEIPTLSSVGLLVLALVVSLVAVMLVRRRRGV
ncbi:MAG: M23 family metallopeptidase [bacterium]|nr:M23 family metallopeptidase [bacterium]